MKKLLILVLIIFTFSWIFIGTGCKEEIILVAEATEEVETISEIIPIAPKEVYEIIIEKKDYFILDVRNPGEYAAGHLEGAVLIPVSELEDRLSELPEDKPIIVYCLTGVKSAYAANILKNNGFNPVYDMGGILGWLAKGYPVIVE